MNLFILWNAAPEIFTLGDFSIRWYGLFFALGFLIGQQILTWMYKKEGNNIRDIETITVYMLVGTIVGARLGHCLFYEPDYFLSHPLEILYIWQGGLASHGATVGILLSIYLYTRKQAKQTYLYVLDRIVIAIALAGCLIRLGNLMNSEIIGKPTDLSSSFIFIHGVEESIMNNLGDKVDKVSYTAIDKPMMYENKTVQPLEVVVHLSPTGINTSDDILQYALNESLYNNYDYLGEQKYTLPEKLVFTNSTNEQGKKIILFKIYGIPRHPSQLYEALSSLALFLLLIGIYIKKNGNIPEGRIFGLFVVILFTLRFLYEFSKENQVGFEDQLPFNMGQLLSVPLILAGLYVLLRSYRNKKEIS